MKKTFTTLATILFFFSYNYVGAATISLVPESRVLDMNQEFYVDIKVDTKEDFINAVQSKVYFSNDVVEMVGFSKDESIFNFWIGEPDISNNEGSVSFIGGTDRGSTGDSLQILRLKFKTIGSGEASISLSESVVTANDGKGTNILDLIENTSVAVGTRVSETQKIPDLPVELPERVEREAVIASKLPEAPEVRVPLYPDPTKWYNHQEETTVLWNVPDDVTAVAVIANKSPRTEPPLAEDALFTGKNVGVLEEGENYIHVQFKNSEGWGEVTHFKVSIDITPPPFFNATISSVVSDNPSPVVQYKNEDSLSGYSHALLFVDNGDSIYSTTTPFKLPPQKPGKHNLIVRVFDKAGNSSEDILNFETLPLEKPVIEFITSKISQEDVLFVSGRSISKGFVDYRVFKGDNEVFVGVAESGIEGKWKASIEEVLLPGDYFMIFNSRDQRGAVSYNTDPVDIHVNPRSVISFGIIDLGWFEIALIIILLVISGGSLGSWYYVVERDKKMAYGVVASRDVTKLSKLLGDNLTEIENIIKQQKRMQKGLRPQLNTVFAKMRSNIDNMKKYLGKTIEKSK